MANADHSRPQLRVLETAQPDPRRRERRVALRLRMAERLHTTLDPVEVLTRFTAELQRELAIPAVAFRTDSGEQLMLSNLEGAHRCCFELRLGQLRLGDLTLQRRRRFNERELELMEVMVGCLIAPLHNALLHRDAMRSASRDALTGVGNRMALELAASHEIALARRHHTAAALLVLDIDHFKRINDEHGHVAGDRTLVELADLLRQTCRDSDNLFRFGGEEFVLLLSQTDEEGAVVIAERIRGAVAARWNGDARLTVSIGVAALQPGENLSGWFERADQALYLGKQNGRNRVVRAVAQAH